MLRLILVFTATLALCAILEGCGNNNSGTPAKSGPPRPVPTTPVPPPSSGISVQPGPGAPTGGSTGGAGTRPRSGG